MKAQDLRLGNKVLDYGNRTVTIESIEVPYNGDVFFRVKENGNHYLIEDLKPIELNKSMFTKINWQIIDNSKGVFCSKQLNNEFYIVHNPNGFWLCANEYENDEGYHEEVCMKLEHIKYLHQLQNLYHSLTGEEIEL